MRFLIGLLVGLVLGWIFPVEGPVDYVYDDYVKPHKQASVNVAMPKEVIDVEEEPEEFDFLFWLPKKEDNEQ